MSRRAGVRRGAASDPVSGPARQRGQATVEAALLLPFIALVLLAVIQIGLVVRTRILVTHAAREGVRVAAVGGTDAEIARAAAIAGDLALHRIHVEVERTGGVATVIVVYTDPTDVPLVGSLIGDAEMEAVARMRIEGP